MFDSNNKIRFIRHMTEPARMEKEYILQQNIDDCPICLAKEVTIISPKGYENDSCNHFICRECWKNIGERKPECPMCRKDLTKWMKEYLGTDICSKEAYDEEDDPLMDYSLMNDPIAELIQQLVSRSGDGGGASSIIQIISIPPSSERNPSAPSNGIRRRAVEIPSSRSDQLAPPLPLSNQSGYNDGMISSHRELSALVPPRDGPLLLVQNNLTPPSLPDLFSVPPTGLPYPRGSPENPFSWGEVIDGKFYCCCGAIVNASGARRHLKTQRHNNWLVSNGY